MRKQYQVTEIRIEVVDSKIHLVRRSKDGSIDDILSIALELKDDIIKGASVSVQAPAAPYSPPWCIKLKDILPSGYAILPNPSNT